MEGSVPHVGGDGEAVVGAEASSQRLVERVRVEHERVVEGADEVVHRTIVRMARQQRVVGEERGFQDLGYKWEEMK